jgi:hypothetical protein
MANTFELIASSTVGSGGASSISFSSIASTWTDLVLKLSGRVNNGGNEANVSISINSSTSNFSQKGLYGDGSAAGSFSRTDNLNIVLVVASGATASTFGNAELYLPNYAGSTNKSFSVDDVSENNATTAYAQMHAGLWSNTAAITSIALTPQGGGSFVQYSTAYLYGVKNA